MCGDAYVPRGPECRLVSAVTNDHDFLPDVAPRPWQPAGKRPPRAVGLYLGNGTSAIEVAVASSSRPPGRGVMLETWKARRAGRAAPVLLIVLHPSGASVCGATGESPPVYPKVDREQAERLAGEVLAQPDRHAALRFLNQALPSLESALPGISNEGLVALHELEYGARRRADWSDAKRKAAAVLGRRDRELVEALGFQMERLDNLTFLLRGGNRRSALAVLLREDESPEAGADRFNSLSPISYALAKADDESLAWVIVVQGNRLRLYSTDLGAGVGRRGRTETYIECQPPLLGEADLAYLWLLYSAEALAQNGSLQGILDGSHRFAGDLASRLRERVYEEVVPALAHGIAKARKLPEPCPKPELDHTYEMALTVLFRLLFIAYAEDRDLLPYRFNDAYRRRSLKQKAQELVEHIRTDTPIAEGDSHWHEVGLLWRAVADGNGEWAVPAYNGGLFSEDPAVSRTGADLSAVSLANEDFETALRALLVIDTTEDVPGPVDFRSLGVREFGTIYEGLLESELAVADADLAIDKGGTYVPAKPKDTVVVSAGEVYLHNRSGARKSSGSYYTKRFAVEYLLDGALEPALDDHFSRLDDMDDTDASKAFFDFRVVDIAMGSGHFLIAAIDRIERRMADYLARRSLPGVRNQLASLRNAATQSLGPLADAATIEDGQLLRRMIARRCTYGVDLNALSVQLARVSVWIHTFVPGLPLSVLDHTLVRGNALVGVGTIEDIRGKFAAIRHRYSFLLRATNTDELLGAAAAPLGRLANVNDATLADIATAREAMQQAREAVRETEALCDLIAAVPLSNDEKVTGFPLEEWRKNELWGGAPAASARRELDGLAALHFPVAFPEVFLRDRPGFDVVLGNPPWQEATIEEHAFWARHFPGLRSLLQREQEAEKARLREARPDLVQQYEAELSETSRIRDALVVEGFPGMGTGDPDLYKAFCWRFWHLTAVDGGRIGVVLPRSALAAKGSARFRETMFGLSSQVDVTTLLNSRRWAFDMEPRYTIALVCLTRGQAGGDGLRLRGPYASHEDFKRGIGQDPAALNPAEVLRWNDTASLPLLPSEHSVDVFLQIRKAPRLDTKVEDEWRARPDTELHATNQKPLMDLTSATCPDGYWPVYKGESFDIWVPDTGVYYAWADPKPVQDYLQSKRLRSAKQRRNSAHGEFTLVHLQDPSTLPCLSPRIAFRDVTRATDTRTVRVALLPAGVFMGNQAPYLLWPRGGQEKNQAFLLGVLSSLPLDWYARRFVETHVSYFVFNPLPVPRPERGTPHWQRVVRLAGQLACPDDRFATWAEAVGVDCGPVAQDEKDDMVHELDAVVAHLYGLNERQLVHVFETFHEGWDYSDRLAGVLEHYRDWARRG